MSKIYKIVNKYTGETLKQYLKNKNHKTISLINDKNHSNNYEHCQITYILSEKGTPGFIYTDFYTFPVWLDRNNWRVEYNFNKE